MLLVSFFQRMHLFLVRFTTILWVPVTCSGCGKSWRLGDKHYCCLDCPNVNLCEDCFYCEYFRANRSVRIIMDSSGSIKMLNLPFAPLFNNTIQFFLEIYLYFFQNEQQFYSSSQSVWIDREPENRVGTRSRFP